MLAHIRIDWVFSLVGWSGVCWPYHPARLSSQTRLSSVWSFFCYALVQPCYSLNGWRNREWQRQFSFRYLHLSKISARNLLIFLNPVCVPVRFQSLDIGNRWAHFCMNSCRTVSGAKRFCGHILWRTDGACFDRFAHNGLRVFCVLPQCGSSCPKILQMQISLGAVSTASLYDWDCKERCSGSFLSVLKYF